MRNKGKQFPYPVLSKETDDVLNSSLDFKYTIIENINFKCHVEVELRNPTLKKLIKENKAAIAVHIECPKTRYREIKTYNKYDFEFEIENKLLSNRVEVASMIVAKENFSYKNANFNSDYEGDNYFILKNNILAYDDDISFDIERNTDSLENLPSIFSIVEDRESNAAGIDLELTETKVKIKLNHENYELYKNLRNNQEFEQVLASLFIMPSLVNILSSFSDLEADYGNSNWFHSINNRLKDIGVSKGEDTGENALKLAQEILGDTFRSSLNTLLEVSIGTGE